ncbi:response regulator transcription factor [Streptomyces sp. NPDC052164]|uniref:helix-turn-helix transcriptional regulator n=1 Tax=Streptomyces sp. NPDC052164 TaxID=3155529 RepID=UPI00344005A0
MDRELSPHCEHRYKFISCPEPLRFGFLRQYSRPGTVHVVNDPEAWMPHTDTDRGRHGAIRVLAPGCRSLFTAGLATALGRTPGLEVLPADDGADFPDVALLEDVPAVPVADTLAGLVRRLPQGPGDRRPKIIVMMRDPRIDRIFAYLQADVRGFVCHDAPLAELVTAVEVVFRNEAFLPHGIALQVIDGILPYLPKPASEIWPHMDTLTGREREIFALMASGESNAEIADAFSLSQKTVKFHVSNILRKLGMKNRIQAVARASGTHRATV